MTGSPSDDWSRVTSISEWGEAWYYCSGDHYKTGEVEQDATLYRNDSENISGREEWSLVQRGWMYPGQDNDFYNEWGSANNFQTFISQNWDGASDVGPTDHKDHTPKKDKESSFDVQLTVTTDGAGVAIDYNIPYIQRDVQYDPGRLVDTEYTYPYSLFGGQEARDVNCNHEQMSIWETDSPSDGDTIASSDYYGEFRHGGCSSDMDTSSEGEYAFLEYRS